MRSKLVFVLAFSLPGSLVAQYQTDFEAFTASATGTPCAGQDNFYVPTVAGSIDGAIYTYAGNTLGIPVNPNGGANFWAGLAITGGPARSQRMVTVTGAAQMYIEFDICANYLGTAATPPNNIGSFSFQNSASSTYVNLLARWPTTIPSPLTWNADYVDAAGAQVSVPDPAFQNLPVGVWHTWGVTIDFATAQHVDFRITNGATGLTTIYTVPAGTAPLPGSTTFPGVLPTDFRVFAGGADDVMAVDNLVINSADYLPFGAGCAGSLGVPTLGRAGKSLPLPGTTFTAELRNLPNNLAILTTGFSNTLLGGAITLPFDLTSAGFPGCNLLVDPSINQFLIGSNNTATWTLSLPPGAQFLGTRFFQQAIVLDTGSPGAAFTNGAIARVGY